jgi:hypothetical protein
LDLSQDLEGNVVLCAGLFMPGIPTRNSRLRTREDAAMWNDDMLKRHEEFARWLLEHADTDYDPPMPTFDSTSTPPALLAEQIKEYIGLKWHESVGEEKKGTGV